MKGKYKVNLKNREVKEVLGLLKSYGLDYEFSSALGEELGGTYNQHTFMIKLNTVYPNLTEFLSSVFHELSHHICNFEGKFPMCYQPNFNSEKGKKAFKNNYFKMEMATDDLAEELMGYYFPKRKYARGFYDNHSSRELCLIQAEMVIHEHEKQVTAFKYLRKMLKDKKLRKYIKDMV